MIFFHPINTVFIGIYLLSTACFDRIITQPCRISGQNAAKMPLILRLTRFFFAFQYDFSFQKNIMAITEPQVRALKASFDQIDTEVVATLLFDRLFEVNPEMRRIFGWSLDDTKQKFMAALKVLAASADDIEKMRPEAERLGRIHAGYGAKDEHYEAIGVALLWALEANLEGGFTKIMGRAWINFYQELSNMMRGAKSE